MSISGDSVSEKVKDNSSNNSEKLVNLVLYTSYILFLSCSTCHMQEINGLSTASETNPDTPILSNNLFNSKKSIYLHIG